jgi:hypothetical protein
MHEINITACAADKIGDENGIKTERRVRGKLKYGKYEINTKIMVEDTNGMEIVDPIRTKSIYIK